ncbi:hypothetical protein SAMN06265379_111127 [Saccharicrinis carchari]|uniref:Uncharacterized protein n=1 Tax=Saccharicrinis carchari TaxID=1168039 RepID=A0A521EVW1_SACCC|nr:hypothetical protein SAMN06265379_111127 [Saccharicrinis carchari]
MEFADLDHRFASINNTRAASYLPIPQESRLKINTLIYSTLEPPPLYSRFNKDNLK